MNPDSNEIEMQMYALDYGDNANYPRQLPYYWDGESDIPLEVPDFLVEEDKAAPRPAQLFSDDEDDFEMKVDTGMEAETRREQLSAPEYPPNVPPCPWGTQPQPHPPPEPYDPREGQKKPAGSEGASSLSSQSTEGPRSLNAPSNSFEPIEQQLDFILESIRKQKKKETKPIRGPSRARRIRTRKTSAQLEFLQNELKGCEVLDKEKMKSLAEKTGLSESQVYKWFWDHRRKQDLVTTNSL